MRTNRLFSINVRNIVIVYRDNLIDKSLPLTCKQYNHVTYSTAKRIRHILSSYKYIVIASLPYYGGIPHPEFSIYNEMKG